MPKTYLDIFKDLMQDKAIDMARLSLMDLITLERIQPFDAGIAAQLGMTAYQFAHDKIAQELNRREESAASKTSIHCTTGTTYHLPNNTAVTLIDTMPTLGFYTYADGQRISRADARILWAARQSTRSTAEVQSALTTYERDKKLFTRLWREHHATPFEFVQVQLHVVCSLTTRSQWHRHRSASYNEYSRRYSEEWTDRQTPQWRGQSASNKQVGDGLVSDEVQSKWSAAFEAFWQNAVALYEGALEDGIAREVARDFLPTSTLTRFAVSVNLRNLMGFLSLRCAPDAQKEIQALACIIRDEMLPQISPWMYELIEKE